MKLRRRLAALAAVAWALACSADSIPGPPAGLEYAAAFRSCGPADGPAVAVILGPAPIQSTDPPTPYVRISIAVPVEELSGRSWTVGGNVDNDASASYVAGSHFEPASAGWVAVKSVGPDSMLLGSALLRFPNRGQVSGGFTAKWLDVLLLCG